MLKELKEVREALASLEQTAGIAAMTDEPVRVKARKALATLDRILNQDEAEMVDAAAAAIWNYAQELGDERMDIDPTKDDCIAMAKAALRALGLIEGE